VWFLLWGFGDGLDGGGWGRWCVGYLVRCIKPDMPALALSVVVWTNGVITWVSDGVFPEEGVVVFYCPFA